MVLPTLSSDGLSIYCGDSVEVLRSFPSDSVDMALTSPPFYLQRSYLSPDHPLKAFEIGTEEYVDEWVINLCQVFGAMRRVVKPTGVFWLEVGDKSIDSELVGAPWMLALELKKYGWRLSKVVIWNKTNAIPTSAKRGPPQSHTYIFMFSKEKHFYYDSMAVREEAKWERWGNQTSPKYQSGDGTKSGFIQERTKEEIEKKFGKTKAVRSVWSVPTDNYSGKHRSPMTQEIARRCILLGSPPGGVVLDPLAGAGTTGLLARQYGREAILIDIDEESCREAYERIVGKEIRIHD